MHIPILPSWAYEQAAAKVSSEQIPQIMEDLRKHIERAVRNRYAHELPRWSRIQYDAVCDVWRVSFVSDGIRVEVEV